MYTIEQLSTITGLTTRTLRNYLKRTFSKAAKRLASGSSQSSRC